MNRSSFFLTFLVLIFFGCDKKNNSNKIISYYPDKKIKMEIQNDTFYWYYPSGNIDQKYGYINDKKEGLSYSFFPNGDTARISFYKNDSLDGKFVAFYENGNKKAVSNYIKDKEEGIGYYFHENGNIADMTYSKMGSLIDSQYGYDEKGRLQEKYYIDSVGSIDEMIYYDSTGNISEVRKTDRVKSKE